MNEKRIAALRVAEWYHILPIKPGMQLELHEHVGEGNNKRIWKFKGLVINVKKKNHVDGTFTIRGKVAGHTVEKIYPLSFPNFAKVLLTDQYKIRRAKLYYIREKVGKDARMKSLLTNADKWVDLLEIATTEAEALKKAYDEANAPAPVEAPVADEVAETTDTSVVDIASTEETSSEE